jgi:hypothetical protein
MSSFQFFTKFFLSCLFFLFSCASTGSGPQPLIYSEQILGLYSNGLKSKKQGEACAQSFFGLLAFGDASTQQAQKNALVQDIHSIDQRSLNFLGIYAKLCTVVNGI